MREGASCLFGQRVLIDCLLESYGVLWGMAVELSNAEILSMSQDLREEGHPSKLSYKVLNVSIGMRKVSLFFFFLVFSFVEILGTGNNI